MNTIEAELTRKRAQLKTMQESRSAAACKATHSTSVDMRREMEIEELQEDIKALERQLVG